MTDTQRPSKDYERTIRETQREESAALCEQSAELRGRARHYVATQAQLRLDFGVLRGYVEALLNHRPLGRRIARRA